MNGGFSALKQEPHSLDTERLTDCQSDHVSTERTVESLDLETQSPWFC